MEGEPVQPFRGAGSGGWSLNYSNPVVAEFTADDAADARTMGNIGTLSGTAGDYARIWALVDRGIGLDEIGREWTFDRIVAFGEYRRMAADYSSAWQTLYARQRRAETERK